MTAPQGVQRLSRFSLTTADAERLAAFYESTFGCRRLSTERLSGPEFEALMGVQGGALRTTLSLGEQIIELLEFDRRGKDYPEDAPVSDLRFQHFAIVVSDMAEAYRRLAAIEGWTAISRNGPQRLPVSSGGVTAFKFRDPEGHPLEFLAFPQGAVPPQWKAKADATLCQGIDHSAISVSDTALSISFYKAYGLGVAACSLNSGAAQESLDDLASVQIDVTALAPPRACPHVELLQYRGTSKPGTIRSNADIASTRLVFEAAGAMPSRGVVDPDGHHVLVEPCG